MSESTEQKLDGSPEEQTNASNIFPQNQNTKEAVGWTHLTLAVGYPIFVIIFELSTHMCAKEFFDPMPTIYHKVLVFLVPATNFLLWWKLRYGSQLNVGFLLLLGAISIGISGYYAVIFLPLMPVSLIAIIIYGLGLLPFAPAVSFIMSIKLFNRLKNNSEVIGKHYKLKGVGIALLALVLLDIPSSANYLALEWAVSDSPEKQEKGVQLLRTFGGKDLLLRLSYGGSRRAMGILSFTILATGEKVHISSINAREIFYKVTGERFNMYPVPYSGRTWSRFDDFRFDPDQGGTQVGGRIKGLELMSSRLDGSVSADDGVVYFEWVFEFKNHSARQREARLQVALPPESVISRATLWVNGEEKEAAFAAKGKVRQAYERVVRARRDPLLVTTVGTDQILAQAFPIAQRGGTIKFKIGITAPLILNDLENASLILPSIVDRNFNIEEYTKHSIWFESRQPIQLDWAGIDNQKIKSNLYRTVGSISDKDLSSIRKVLTAKRDANVMQLISGFSDNEQVLQNIINVRLEDKRTLLLVVDGSYKMGAHIEEIIESFKHIPIGTNVGLIIAAGKNVNVTFAKWSDSHRLKIETSLRNFEFVGGHDNAPALANAFKQLEQYVASELLWIHAPQPILFNGTQALLEQATNRLARLPKVSLYSIHPGPNKLLDDSAWVLKSGTIPRVGAVRTDLEEYFISLFSKTAKPKFSRSIVDTKIDVDSKTRIEAGSKHIARLWAKDQVYSLLAEKKTKDAIDLAARYQLVTAVSGAVVLESQQQFKDSGLTPVGENTVPTIPEPHQWILAFIMVIFIIWFLRQNKLALIKQV